MGNSNLIFIDSFPNDDFSDLWFNGFGWYWADETTFLHGPYATEAEAFKCLENYVREFL